MLVNDDLLLLGIRHHGPGSAASVLGALRSFAPDILLVEGAPEAQDILAFAKDPQLKPPVAQLIYAPDDHRDSVFYPFTEFSPEWQAIRYAQQQNIPLSFFDLPQVHSLALARQAREADPQADEQPPAEAPTEASAPQADGSDCSGQQLDSLLLPEDPLDLLAQAAGFDDGERWWEHVVEQHRHDIDLFSGIADAMVVVRDEMERYRTISRREQRREAWMRRMLRKTQKEGAGKIAVICGAWHVPALMKKVPVKDDNALLKSLPKIKLQATWIPWSYGRISYHSGYGAGVESPGWYHHLWQHAKKTVEPHLSPGAKLPSVSASWLTLAARTLREEGYDVPPASVIEAVRLAETLAVLRERHLPNLDEMTEAIQTLYCFGESTPLVLLQQKLFVGERLGEVPEGLPQTPLQEDFARQLKLLRLKTQAVEHQLELDLRKEIGLTRSQLFHRLNILEIPWAKNVSGRRGKGTFKDVWTLQWNPEFALALIEKCIWGNNLQSAAGNFALHQIRKSQNIKAITEWLDGLILANLTEAIGQAIDHLQTQAAVVTHVEETMAALPGLINIVRYGDVRGSDGAVLSHLITGFVARIIVGLPTQFRHLDDDAAKEMNGSIAEVDGALQVLNNSEHIEKWYKTLHKLVALEDVHGLIAGKCYKLLVNANIISDDVAADALALALSRAEDPQHAAAWLEGLLEGGGLMLVHDDKLWSVIDAYIGRLSQERFLEITPLLRRTFASFSSSERQNILRKAATFDRNQSGSSPHRGGDLENFDQSHADATLPLLDLILGYSS